MADFSPNARTSPTMITQQLRGPENQNAARVVVDMADMILMYQPEATPLLTLTAKLRNKREAKNPRFEWLEKDEYPRQTTATGTATDAGTSIAIPVGDEARFAAGYVVKNLNTGEQFIVGSTASGSLGTLTRGVGGGAAPIAVGDVLLFTRSVYEDGAGLGAPRSIQEFSKFNFTEIIRTPYGFTGQDLVTELYGGRDEVTETQWQSIEHKKSIEYAMFFGKRDSITGTHVKRFMGGLEFFLATNVWNVSNVSLSARSFTEFLEEGMRWGKGGNQNGAGVKYLLCSSRWLTEINDWAAQKLEYRVLDKQIGFSAMAFMSPHGEVRLLRAPLLDKDHPDYAFLLDLNHLRYANLRQRDTKLLYDRQANDVDGRINEYMSDVSIQVEFEHSHALLKGLA